VCVRARGRRCRAVRRTLKIQPCQGQARMRARAPLVHYNIIIMCERTIVLQRRSLPCIFFYLLLLYLSLRNLVVFTIIFRIHAHKDTVLTNVNVHQLLLM